MSKKKLNNLKDLSTLLTDEQKNAIDKNEYQAKWQKKTNKYRRVVSEKNRKWIKDGRKSAIQSMHFDFFKQHQEYYDLIKTEFENPRKTNFYIHLLSHFLPIDRTFKAPKIPMNKHICPITKLELTSIKDIMVGDREKHLAFGSNTSDILISGIGLQELERFALDYTKMFNTKNGQIINFAIDEVRCTLTGFTKNK
jgi:hypothetical protein